MKSSIEQKVMANVGVIYAGRTLISKTALECYALAFSGFGIASLVSVPHVVHNLQAVGIVKLPVFLEVAVLKTHAVVQLALTVGIVALLLLFTDIFRTGVHARVSRLSFR